MKKLFNRSNTFPIEILKTCIDLGDCEDEKINTQECLQDAGLCSKSEDNIIIFPIFLLF